MTNKIFVLKDVTDFAPGAFENTVVDGGAIQLGHGGGGFLPAGTYTSAPFSPPAFRRLIPSWNADTPPGTAVEAQARVAAGGRWSRWFSFGRWSPFIDRASPPPLENELARLEAEMLFLLPGRQSADTAQMRISLYTNDSSISPVVRLLSGSTDSLSRQNEKDTAGERLLEVPTYSCLVRDPTIGQRMAGATAMAMLMNRWGEDVLPEEVARAAYDSGSSRFANLAFLCAIAGAYGFESYASFSSIDTIRREVWRGDSVGAMVRYRAPALGEKENGEEKPVSLLPLTLPNPEAPPPAPLLERATVDSNGHLVVVRGFTQKDGVEHVVFNDPLAPSDEKVRREIPLSKFAEIFTGLCVHLFRAPHGAGSAKPVRITGDLLLENNEITIRSHDKPLLVGESDAFPRSTVCYTLSDGIAYASAAQKKFYYPRPTENGVLHFDRSAAAGRKLTFYRVGPLGTTWVAEKSIPPNP